jgi:hypothetical protein
VLALVQLSSTSTRACFLLAMLLHHWVTKILGYDFEIVYKKGKKNVVVDALSGKDEDVAAFLCAISIIQPNWIIEARDEWKNDEKIVDSHSKVAT